MREDRVRIVPLSLMGAEVIHHRELPGAQGRAKNSFDVGLLKSVAVVAPSMAREGLIPSVLMLDSSVVLGPRLRGTDP